MTKKKKKSIVNDRLRIAQDYTHKLPMMLHDDGLRAYQELKERYRGRARSQREAINIALMLYAKVSRQMNLGPGDPIEDILRLNN